MHRPAGYTIETPDPDESFSWFKKILVPVVLLLFAVLALTFESLTLPLLVLVSLPLTVLGATWALVITDTPADYMALVGPRPEELRLVERYDVWQRRRLKMKPGITGLQQVVARGHLADLSQRVRLDVYYTRKQSILLDLVILVRTVGAVLSGRGAT